MNVCKGNELKSVKFRIQEVKSELSVQGLFLETFCRNIGYFQKTNLISFSYLQLILTTHCKCMVHPSRKLLRKHYLQHFTVQPNSTDMSVEKKRRDNEQSNQNKKITAEISKTETSFFRGKGFRGKGFRNKSFLDEHN